MWNMWRRMFRWWQWQFSKIGWLVGRRPLIVTAVCLFLVTLCGLGLLNAKFVKELDQLWVPSNSQTIKDQKKFDSLFPSNPYSRLERIIVVPRNQSADMLTTDRLSQTFDMFNSIMNLAVAPAEAISTVNATVGYSQMCATPIKNAGCVYYSPLGYWKVNETYMRSRTPEELHKDVNQLLLSGSIPVEQRQVLGCLIIAPSSVFQGDTVVVRVGSLTFSLFVDTSKVSVATIELWEKALLDLLGSLSYPDILVYGQTGVSVAEEITHQESGDVVLLAIGYVVMAIYMVLALGGLPPLRSRCLLGLGAVGTVALGIVASLGFSALFFKFNPLSVQVLPFLMLSIGMDSVFILFSHFHKAIRAHLHITPAPLTNEHLAKALQDSMYRQGASVALTALTKAVAFLGPAAVLRIPALQEFCVMTAISVIFELVLSLLLFNALLVFDARREQSHRADILPCIVLRSHNPVPSSPVCCKPFQDQATEKSDGPADPPLPPSVPPATQSFSNGEGAAAQKQGEEKAPGVVVETKEVSSAAEAEARAGFLDHSVVEVEDKASWLGRFLGEFYVPKFVGHPIGQAVIMLAFAGLLAVGIYGCVNIDESLDVRTLITEGTQLYNYLGEETRCNSHIGPPMFLVTEEADYTALDTQDVIKHLISDVQNSSYIEPPVYSWYSDFLYRFLPYSKWLPLLDASGQPKTKDIFYQALDDFLNNSLEGFPYSYDIIFTRGNATNSSVATGITASRMRSFYRPLANTSDFVGAMKDVRNRVAQETRIKAFTQSYFYVYYEQFISIVDQYVLMLCLTVVAIWVVTVSFMGFKTAFIVAGLVLMIHVDMLGLVAEWGVQLNAVSAVNAVAIMGLADEYVNYIMRAFELGEGDSQARVTDALLQYLQPISNAACSTIIGVIPLAFAKSAAYKVYYFRMFLVATLLSWGTGAIFLPAFLLLTHRGRCTSGQDEEDGKDIEAHDSGEPIK